MQKLNTCDSDSRKRACEAIVKHPPHDMLVFFNDKAHFLLSGYVNEKKCNIGAVRIMFISGPDFPSRLNIAMSDMWMDIKSHSITFCLWTNPYYHIGRRRVTIANILR